MGLQKFDVLFDEPMSRHTTFAIGGNAEIFVRCRNADELIALLKEYPDALVIGNGSNLLVSDAGIHGMVISTVLMKTLKFLSKNKIQADSGVSLAALAAFAQKNSLTGLEFASGIPGTLGGAVVMNAGAYDGEIGRVIESSDYFEGDVHTITDHRFSYRRSIYAEHPKRVILSAVLKLDEGDFEKIREKTLGLNAIRKAKQPLEYPSAGSVFKRPGENIYVGRLIEDAGLKGFSIGGAQVSEKHAGFIVNKGGATCDDVRKLIEHIQSTVLSRFGVALETEIKLVGG